MLFADIHGQPKAVRLLRRALESGRMAHAYLFFGPEGVGKLAAAKAMAQSLLCSAAAGRPCGTCSACRKFLSENHPDFVHITPAGTAIKIDQIRSLKQQVAFAPFEANRRVVLLEDIQTMGREAGNSLLKLLEEPPPDNVLLLVASDAQPILPTILSRCQVIPFYPLPLHLAADVLQQRNPEMDRESALALASLVEGAPGRAGDLETEGLLELRKEIVDFLLSPPEEQALQMETSLLLAGRMADSGDNLENLFQLLGFYFKEAMVFQCDPEFVQERDPARSRELAASRERWNLEQLSAKVQAVEEARRALARNCNRAAVCEVLLFRFVF